MNRRFKNLCVCVPASVHLSAMCMQELMEVRAPGPGVVDGCEPPCGCWEPSSGSLQVQ